tara:strand:- start:1003 stop:1704 length:702 start_codon:yes stop_codon:yes gene_type:complete
MNVINDCSNLKVKVFYKKNTADHTHIKYDNKPLTDGILIQRGYNLDYLESGSTDFINFITNTEYIKTLTVKSHLPNIGYYNIAINTDNNINSISKSTYFNNWYDTDGVLKGLIIGDTTNHFSVQKDVYVQENITAFDVSIPSDIRLKKDVKNITNGLEIINKLRPVSFNWKKNNNESIGFIAQEIEEVLPEFVRDTRLNGETIKTIKQDKLIPYIVDSIKNISNRLKKYESSN